MTIRFSNFCNAFVLKWECDWPGDKSGQLSNDPSDPGGLTRWGIDKRAHPKVDIANLTHDGALAIYYSEWQSEGCEAMSQPEGEAFFDAAVNCGLTRARQFDKGSFNARQMIAMREAYYYRLAAARPSLKKFLNGWINRTTDLRKYLNV